MSLLNQFLMLLGSSKEIQVMACTNYPWELQEAVRRRFNHVLYVPLPTAAERKLLFEKFFGGIKENFTETELNYAASETAG